MNKKELKIAHEKIDSVLTWDKIDDTARGKLTEAINHIEKSIQKPKNIKKEITINAEQKLYVIPQGEGFSCLGFDVCEKRSAALAKEMNEKRIITLPGTIEHYNDYLRLIEIARKKNQATGWRSNSELTPEFIGHEREQVKITQRDGITRTFYIGKSSGFIPVHLEVSRVNSSGGPAVCLLPGDTWVFTGKRRY